MTEWMTVDAFVEKAFLGDTPESKVLWITADVRARLEDILDRSYPGLRVRYWAHDTRTAWVLEQIGKERPITAGFVVDDGRVLFTEVLTYRESRGGEIRYQSFRDQFVGVSYNKKGLDKHIDGITGATLSVRSMKQMAEAALHMARFVDHPEK